ncbi:MAG: right-handed parallel beta-helix repeat-containing protein [Clostridia bacterium]|nr:right-handed parallel beta-helix repeat-containing protein [Clostridia bacterium]
MAKLNRHAAGAKALFPAMGLLWGATSYYYMKWIVPVYGALLALVLVCIFAVDFITERQRMKPKKKAALHAAVLTACFGVVYFALSFLVNNVLWGGGKSYLTILVLLAAFLVFYCVLYVRWKKSYSGLVGKKRSLWSPLIGAAAAVAVVCLPVFFGHLLPEYYTTHQIREPAPAVYGSYTQKEAATMTDAQFYVSVSDGDDTYEGTLDRPFATLEKAREAVRALEKTGLPGVTVAVKAGEYRVAGLSFTKEDGGSQTCPVTYCAYGDGEVVLNGGMTLPPEAFSPVTDEAMLARLTEDAKQKVVCVKLADLGVTKAQYGKIYAVGSYNTAGRYDGDWAGDIYCELFVNDKRQNLARYPDTGWLETEEVVETGYGRETDGSLTARANWDEVRNPAPDVYRVSQELADRVVAWKTLDDVWVFGYWKYDWADASSPIGSFDHENRTLSPKFVSTFGTKTGAPYYFFNVFEELDAPGEWYLDRDAGVLYLYPDGDLSGAVIDLSLTTQPILAVEGATDLTFRGFTVKGTRGDAIVVSGDRIAVADCLIKNIAGNAVVMNGCDNLAADNEITRTGKGGIILSGGDVETLVPGNSRAENNLIHDWSEIYQTYQPAVTLNGVGNICAHNEMFNSPHEAITYAGNNHVMEYNLIHDVCLLSDDAGAIYSGRRWDWYGDVIRYNCIYNIGSGQHRPVGIYLDDALSGQTVYGNLIVNAPSIGIQLGGGRDLDVRNNVVVNTNVNPFTYDQRAADGVTGGWFTHSSRKDGDMWQLLYGSPWQSAVWQKAFPAMTRFSDDFDHTDSPDFVPNPAYSKVTGNVVVSIGGKLGGISELAEKYSDISGNAVFRPRQTADVFTDPANGDYSLKEDSLVFNKIPDFEPLPLDEIGRQ